MSRFARDWLRLREDADLAARDPALARRFAAAVSRPASRPVRLIDLGAGTGANCRALLPRIAGDQEWFLVEHDADLIAAQAEAFTLWARRQGYPIRAGGGQIVIDGGASWHLTSLPLDLAADHAALEALAIDGVAASALFDLVSAAWIERLAAFLAARRAPLLAALTVDGRRQWRPALAEDAIIATRFAQHQARDKGFGPALGGTAPEALHHALIAHGFRVSDSASDWRLDGRSAALLAALIAAEAEAATEAAPDHAAVIAAWQEKRRLQLADGKLELTIGHRDLLALPG